MNKIKEIEEFLSKWEADKFEADRKGQYTKAEAVHYKIMGLRSALDIFKRPPNQAIATDAYCHDCRFWYDHNYCPHCGTKLK